MVLTPSTMPDLGTPAPDFALPATDGATVRRDDFAGRPLLVIFMCNHCPYVIHLREHLAAACKELQDRGVGVVGISSNSVETHPADSPEKMVEEVTAVGYTFPYLYDETQEVAKAYCAACTPDFFLYDAEHRVENVHLAAEKHDYGYSKRVAAYNFMAHHLKLRSSALPYDNGYREDFVQVLEPDQLRVFDDTHPVPPDALQGDQAVIDYLGIR